jgi:predicted molibdopterin-dependent oxidoreductase YjgC
MKKAYQLQNLRQIKVSFLGPTNNRGARIKIYESKRYNDDNTKSKIFSYSYSIGDVMEQAFQILVNNGFNVVCRASDFDNYIFLCDNWGENFIEINNLK